MQRSINETCDNIKKAMIDAKHDISDDIFDKIRKRVELDDNFDVDIKPELRQQICLASATGCLIDEDRILTCGHIDDYGKGTFVNTTERFLANPGKFRILFGFRNGEVQDGTLLPAWQVREIRSYVLTLVLI